MKKIFMSRKHGTVSHSPDNDTKLTGSKKLIPVVRSDRISEQFSDFIHGAGSVFDISGSYLSYPVLESLEQDENIIKEDFSIISEDFKQILNANYSRLKA